MLYDEPPKIIMKNDTQVMDLEYLWKDNMYMHLMCYSRHAQPVLNPVVDFNYLREEIWNWVSGFIPMFIDFLKDGSMVLLTCFILHLQHSNFIRSVNFLEFQKSVDTIRTMGDEYEQKIRDLQRFYVDFLDDSDDQGIYSKLVRYV